MLVAGHRPIALAAGYLDPRPAELVRAIRKQVRGQSASQVALAGPDQSWVFWPTAGLAPAKCRRPLPHASKRVAGQHVQASVQESCRELMQAALALCLIPFSTEP